MAEVKKDNPNSPASQKPGNSPAAGKGGTVYGRRQAERKRGRGGRPERMPDEYDQRIVDIARVTRVMAGGKRMRFRACVAIGNKKGKVAVGIDKGADVTIAVTKAVNQAKKLLVDVPIVNDTIPHEIYYKMGAAKILLKPARKGKGVIAGGAVRIVLELAGVKNITSKILGTNNAVNVAKCTLAALDNIKKVEVPKVGNNDAKKKALPATEDKKSVPKNPAK